MLWNCSVSPLLINFSCAYIYSFTFYRYQVSTKNIMCGSGYESGSVPFIFDLLVFIYLGLLQFVGIILAFLTRKVKINVLNDSKSVTALIYISSISCIANALIAFTSRGYINVRVGVFSGLIISLATTFLAIIFIPKVGLAFYII